MSRKTGILIIGFIILMIAITVFIVIQLSPSHQAKNVIEDFYSYEQEGKYVDSWELFHSQMKAKFEKGHYIQDRPRVFMTDFGVTTFDYSVGDVTSTSNWKISEDADPIDTVYQVTVTQTYKGIYGNFDINQEVFATKEKGEWKVLWSYQK